MMKITTELAMPIVNQLMGFLNHNINIMDENGVIVGSGDISRLYKTHEGAVQVITTKQELVITEEDSKHFQSSKPGVNLPIEFNGETVGVVGITGSPEDIYKVANIIKMAVELLLQQIFIKNQVQYQQKAMEGFLIDLINPYEFKEEKLETASQILNIDYGLQRFALLIKIKEITQLYSQMKDPSLLVRADELKTNLIQNITSFIEGPMIYAFLENGILFILAPFNNTQKEKDIGTKVKNSVDGIGYKPIIAMGTSHTDLKGYRESYFQAKQTLKFMDKFNYHKKISHINEWKLVRLIDGIPMNLREEFVLPHINNLNQMNSEYIKTLETWLDSDLDMKKTSEKLHIHRNTLVYRLEKITKELELDYHKFNDLVILKLLLSLKKLQK